MLQATARVAKVSRSQPSEDSMPDLIETVENGIATLMLNRPERLNALSMEIRTGLLEALERLGHDKNVGCIVLTGAGRGFSGRTATSGKFSTCLENRAVSKTTSILNRVLAGKIQSGAGASA